MRGLCFRFKRPPRARRIRDTKRRGRTTHKSVPRTHAAWRLYPGYRPHHGWTNFAQQRSAGISWRELVQLRVSNPLPSRAHLEYELPDFLQSDKQVCPAVARYFRLSAKGFGAFERPRKSEMRPDR